MAQFNAGSGERSTKYFRTRIIKEKKWLPII